MLGLSVSRTIKHEKESKMYRVKYHSDQTGQPLFAVFTSSQSIRFAHLPACPAGSSVWQPDGVSNEYEPRSGFQTSPPLRRAQWRARRANWQYRFMSIPGLKPAVGAKGDAADAAHFVGFGIELDSH